MTKKYFTMFAFCLISLSVNYVTCGYLNTAELTSQNNANYLFEEEKYPKTDVITTTEEQKAYHEQDKIIQQVNLIRAPRVSKRLNALQCILDNTSVGHNDILKQEKILETKLDTLTQLFLNFIGNDVDAVKPSHLEQEVTSKSSALEEMVPAKELEEKLNNTLTNLTERIGALTENFNNRLGALQNLTPNEDLLNQTVETLGEKITSQSDKINKRIDLLEKKLLEVENKVNQKLNSEKIPTGAIKTGCKEIMAREYKYDKLLPINEVMFDNTKLSRTGDGLVYLEMDVAVKAARDGIIMLSPVENPSHDNPVFEIGIGLDQNRRTELRLRMNDEDAVKLLTQDILSASYFVAFKIKISDGMLEFTKKGDSKPLISFYHSRMKTIKYFGFASWDNNDAKLLYDCPLNAWE